MPTVNQTPTGRTFNLGASPTDLALREWIEQCQHDMLKRLESQP